MSYLQGESCLRASWSVWYQTGKCLACGQLNVEVNNFRITPLHPSTLPVLGTSSACHEQCVLAGALGGAAHQGDTFQLGQTQQLRLMELPRILFLCSYSLLLHMADREDLYSTPHYYSEKNRPIF